MSDFEEIEIENSKLKRDIELLKQSLTQVKVIKNAYKDSLNQIKQKDKELHKQVQRTQAIFNAQTSIVITTNGEKLTSVNTQFFKVFAYKDMIDFTSQYNCICELFIDKEDVPHLMPYIDEMTWLEYIDNNPKTVHEAYMLDKNGNERVFEVKSSGKIFDDVEYQNNEEVAVFTDVTDLKENEKQIYESQKNASLGQMIRNIGHQWRQPLATVTAIVNNIKLKSMLGKLDQQATQQLTDEILEGIDYLSDMIDVFGKFVKNDNELHQVTIQNEIHDAVKVFNSIINTNTIEVKIDIKYEDPIDLEMMNKELQDVLIHILTNAKDIIVEKEIIDGWVNIAFDLVQDHILITIEDNGGGILEENISKVFDPYFTTKHQARQVGLSLHTSYKIITENLNGKLYVKNTENGAKFFIEIPIQ